MNTREKDFKEIGLLIRNFRHSKGLSAEEFKSKLSVSLVTLSRIENGHIGPNALIIKRLAEIGMDVSEIGHSARAHSKEQTLSYRLAEVENKLASMEATLREVLKLLPKK